MRSVRITAVLVFCVALTSASGAAAQSPPQPGIYAPDRLDASRRAVIRFILGSSPGFHPRHTTAQIYTGGVVREWHAPGWDCAPLPPPDARFFVCRALTDIAALQSPIILTVEYDRHALRTAISVSVHHGGSLGPSFRFELQHAYYRDYEVTTAADSGPGSLRDAIARSNLECSEPYVSPPCRIAMRLAAPVPAAGWFTLAPLSALPVITAVDVAVDGDAQTALTGDTNPLGPEIFIDGTHVPRTNALQLIGRAQQVRGLAIGGFDHAIVSARPTGGFGPRLIERNHLGVDPTGKHAVPNVRGLMLFAFGGIIERNVIGGNVRSGIYCAQYCGVSIRNNRIGVAAASLAPIPNGASGVFFHNSTSGDVEGNVIANSGEFGVSMSRGANVLVLQNTFARNGSAAIDVGLDGPTGEVVQITSARLASASATWIEGKALLPPLSGPGVVGRTVTVFVYANDSDVAEGERFLGSYRANADGSFSVPVNGDLRGKWISATMRVDTHYVYPEGNHTSSRTSEFGPRLRVSP